MPELKPAAVLLTDQEVADRLRIRPATLEKWRTAGGGPKFIRVGRRPLYRESDLESWLQDQTRSHNNAQG